MSRDDASLLDIVRAARLIVVFTRDLDEAEFVADLKTQLAVIQLFSIIGEATKRLSADFRDRHPEVPWKRIAGMRDKLIHRYDEIELPLVWNAATDAIPKVLAILEPLLPSPPE